MGEGYKQYEPKVLKKIQQEELKVLKEFIRICDKYDINYFGVFGTVIGTVRHQGFIPWDDDMDFGMLRDDYEKFKKHRKSLETFTDWQDRIAFRNIIILYPKCIRRIQDL
jgi:phosphorylcholine metabolism protein LicD